jgi:addiction module HigA family antidote
MRTKLKSSITTEREVIPATKPVRCPPGEVLLDVLDGFRISQSELARHLKMPVSKINEICRGKRGISPAMALRLGRVFGQGTRFWMNVQQNWDLSQLDEEEVDNLETIRRRA